MIERRSIPRPTRLRHPVRKMETRKTGLPSDLELADEALEMIEKAYT